MIWLELRRLRSKVSDERREAQERLIALGHQAVNGLISVLEDRDWRVREAAVKALSEIGDQRATAPLIARLKDDDHTVRQVSIYALERILGPRCQEPILQAGLNEASTDHAN